MLLPDSASEKNQSPKKKKENPKISEITQILQSQVEDLRKHNEVLDNAMKGLQEDKKRLLNENTTLKKEVAILEKKQTGS